MNHRLDREAVILGAGPVGMVAALESSKYRRTTLIAPRLPSIDDVPRVEAVPASLLALLVELGIHPRQVGVEHLHESRSIAWEQEACTEVRAPAEAHVERPALDLALLNAVVSSGRVRLLARDRAVTRAAIVSARHRRVRVIDASGRLAVSARRKIFPRKPWAARMFLVRAHCRRAEAATRIAALPGGFVYRIGASRYVTLGVVGRKETIAGSPSDLEQRLRDSGAGWILDGLPAMTAMTPGSILAASVQWTVEDAAMTVGDAALARDPLSSQGLAAGMSDAMYAASTDGARDDVRRAMRNVEQRAAHLRSLERLIARCRFRRHDAWRGYAAFVRKHVPHDEPRSRMALRGNRIVVVRP